jgi:hypothetical protein
MTEGEWLTATDPRPMLQSLRGKACATDRKLRLFACASARLVWRLAADYQPQKAIEIAERFADGGESDERLHTAGRDVMSWFLYVVEDLSLLDARSSAAIQAGQATCLRRSIHAARVAANQAVEAAGEGTAAGETTRQRLAALLACIVRRLAAPAVDPAWLSWQGAIVVQLAQAAYDERQLPEGTLDPARLALLADALEDAGCTDADLLGHLRGPGPHVRGCWALDLLLAKG